MSSHLASTLLVVSGAGDWPQTAQVITELIARLKDETVVGVQFLGTSRRWAAEDWRSDMPLPPEAAHAIGLIAPVMEALKVRREYPRAVIIVGAGPVLDLFDWLEIESSVRWAWVVVGEPTPDRVDGRVVLATRDDLSPAVALHTLRSPTPRLPRPLSPTGFITHRWALDRAGFPLIYVPPIAGFVQLFPLSKPQFERFLVATSFPALGPAGYAELLKLNPRLSPCAPRLTEPEQLCVTGLIPADMEAYIRWHGHGLRLLTVAEWRLAFQWMLSETPSVWPVELERDLNPVALRLWQGLWTQLQPQTLGQLSLMCGGVVEWASDSGGVWLGMGQPRAQFYPNFHDALLDRPFPPTSLERRSRLFGARLMQPV